MRRVLTISTRKSAGWLVVVVTVVTTTLALATPAQAATITVTATCSSSQVVVDKDDFSAAVGDTIYFVNSTGGDVTLPGKSGVTGTAGTVGTGTGTNLTVTATPGSFDIAPATGCTTGTTVNFGLGGGGSAPPPVIQQFGKPASGTCDAAAPITLNWAGVPSGGWANSWAQWMNGGRGGEVCSRMLVYSSSRGAWTVG